MRYLWLVLLLSSMSHPMEDDLERGRQLVVRDRSNTQDEVEDLTQLIMLFYFDQAEPCVANKVSPKIRREITRLRQQHDRDHQETLHQLQLLRDSMEHKRHSRGPYYRASDIHGEFADMRRHLSRVVADALKDEFDELDDDLSDLRRQLRKESIQKWAAMGCGLVSTLIASSVALIVHFVESENCSSS